MDRWKSDNYESGEGRLPSRSTSLSRRLFSLAGVAALTVGGAAGAVIATSGAAFATQNPISSNYYTVGSVVSGGLSFTASESAASATGVTYTTGFTVPTGVSGTSVTLSGLPDSAASATSAIVTVAGVQSVVSFTPSSGVVNTGSLVAGDQVTIVISGFTNSSAAGTAFTPTAAVGSTTVATGSFTLTSAVASTAAVSVAPTTASYQGSAATFSGFTGLTGNVLDLEVQGGLTFSSTTLASNYVVTYSTAGSSTKTTAPVESVTANATTTGGISYVTLTLGTILSSGDTVNVAANGTTNSGTAGSYYAAMATTSPSSSATLTSGPQFSIGNSMPAISLTVSPANQAASNAVYGVTFTVPSNYTSSDKLVTSFTDSNGATVGLGTGYAIFDTTNPAADSSSSSAATPAGISLTNVAAGDAITVDYYGITNSSAASVSATSFLNPDDTIPATSNSVSYGAASATSSGLNVALSNSEVDGTSTYTISGLIAGGSGVNSASETIALSFNNNAVLPSNLVNYTLTDLTTASSSGLTGSPGVSYDSTTNTETATLTTAEPITAGDKLSITITGVQNPSSASTVDQLTVEGSSTLPLVTNASVTSTVPTAAVTDSNGALIQSGGQIDVIAGGYAFGIPSFADYQKIAGMLGTTVVSGTFPTASAPRAGTLIQPIGQAGIWVVGTNGELYQFSSGAQFAADGYSGMEVIPVPSAGGLTVATGVPPTAAVTTPDGAIVQYGSTLYVYAGGTPFGIPTFADYQKIAAMTGSMVVQGSGTTPVASATTANGVLVQPIGAAGIWVTYNGTLYPFSSPAQLQSDGYNGMYTIPTPGTGSLVVS